MSLVSLSSPLEPMVETNNTGKKVYGSIRTTILCFPYSVGGHEFPQGGTIWKDFSISNTHHLGPKDFGLGKEIISF